MEEDMGDEDLYVKAEKEFKSEERIEPIFLKALTLANGDKELAKYEYIKLRVEDFKNLTNENKLEEKKINELPIKEKIVNELFEVDKGSFGHRHDMLSYEKGSQEPFTGLLEVFYEGSDQLYLKESYKNGLKHGERRQYYKSGRLHISEYFYRGARYGLCHSFHDIRPKWINKRCVYEEACFSQDSAGTESEDWKVVYDEEGLIIESYQNNKKLRFWQSVTKKLPKMIDE